MDAIDWILCFSGLAVIIVIFIAMADGGDDE